MTKIITKFLLCSALLLSSVDHGSLASLAPDGSSVAVDSLEVLYPAVFHEILHHLQTKETAIAGDYTNAHSRKAFDPQICADFRR